MPPEEPRASYRVRRFHRKDWKQRPYHESYEVSDEATGLVLASCDLAGRAVFTNLEITDDAGHHWQVTPNRKVLPSRWTLADDAGAVHLQLDLRLAGKLLNPVQRTSLAVLDASGSEVARLIDGRDGVADRMFGSNINERLLVREAQLLAQFTSLPRQGPQRTGFRAKLARLFTLGDRGVIVRSVDYDLPAPALLALIAIHDEITTPT